MISKTIAARYVRAMMNTVPTNMINKIGQDLKTILDIYSTNPNFANLLETPLIPQHTKKEIVVRILDRYKIEPALIRFMELLVSKKRTDLLADIAEVYSILADEALGVIRAKIKTALPLTETQLQDIKQKLIAVTRKDVTLNIENTPSILGGIAVQIGDRVFDGSVQGKLKDLKEKLLEKT
ncbi:MAG: ATP synthase F1 subunit delta [Planctomycetota bacterium]|nr:ATP synthase F1 subunit delta [Planctomycetota bacterium]